MPFVSIHKKISDLLIRNILGIAATFVVLTILGGVYLTVDTFNTNKKGIEDGIISKGRILVSNNSQVLRGMAEDNAFLAITELVNATVKEDKDVVYGIYMDANRRPWVIAQRDSLENSSQEMAFLNDTLSFWAAGIKSGSDYTVKERKATGNIIEFAAPVTSMGRRLGTIRYGISNESMIQALQKAKFNSFISILVFVIVMVSITIMIFIVGYRSSRTAANAITSPLHDLTDAANAIAKGNYGVEVKTRSNDEVGVLADNFESMRNTIKDYTENLESMVAKRTNQLEKAQKELVDKAHKAGMADIATEVLHNVGNILNSVVTSGNLIKEKVAVSKVQGLVKANELLRSHMDDIEDFLLNDPKGKKLLQYYLALEELLQQENKSLNSHAARLIEKIDAIRDVIAAQQSYTTGAMTERLDITDVINDALNIRANSLARNHIRVEKRFENIPPIDTQKIKLIHIMVNLIKNAKDALLEMPPDKRKITVCVTTADGNALITVADTGCGIRPEDKDKIFTHGFTTKEDGHGFGLHSSANYITEIGGSISVASDGEGKGTAFTLYLPLPEEAPK